MFRAALIGCGRIGSTIAQDHRIHDTYSHAGAYRACDATTLVAVCDVDGDVARRCAANSPGTQAFSELSAMLDQTSPAIVSVCTPDATHAAVIDRVLDAPSVKGILAEKPLALTLPEAERIVRRAHERGIALAVNYSRRYTHGHQLIHDRLRAGEVGEIQNVTGRYTKGVVHNGSHWFDLARWLIGEVQSIDAYPRGPQNASDGDLDVHLRFMNGATGALLSCRADAFSIFEMDIVGSTGRIVIHDSGHRVQRWTIGDSDRYPGYRKAFLVDDSESDMRDSTLNAVADLAECIKKQTQPRCSGADALAALTIAVRALQSSAANRAMPVVAMA